MNKQDWKDLDNYLGSQINRAIITVAIIVAILLWFAARS